MPDAKTIFCAGVIPALLVVVAALASRSWRDGRERWGAVPAVAMAVAFMIGMPCLVDGLTLLPPRNGWHWLFWVAAGVGVVGVVELVAPRRWLVWLVGAVVSVVAYYLLARVFIHRTSRPWTTPIAVQWIAISSVASIVMMLTGDLLTRCNGSARAAACGFAVIAMVSAAQIGFQSSEQHAHVAGIVATCAGAVAALSILMPHLRFGASVWLAIALLLTAVTTVNLDPWYSSVPLQNGLLIFAAPLAAWAALLGDSRRWYAPTAVAIIAVLAPLAPVIVRVVEAAIEFRKQGFL